MRFNIGFSLLNLNRMLYRQPFRLYNEKKAAEAYLQTRINFNRISESSKEIADCIRGENCFNLLNQIKIYQFAEKFNNSQNHNEIDSHIKELITQYHEAVLIYNRVFLNQKVRYFGIHYMNSYDLEKEPFKLIHYDTESGFLEMLVEVVSHSEPQFCAYWDENVSRLYVGRKKDGAFNVALENDSKCRLPQPKKMWVSIDIDLNYRREMEVLETDGIISNLLFKI